ncbi:beta-L-arabinofuranosidase domain-containing protein [Actinopolymorpha sp. B17G11]|uniref:glycoside hydrolase family 127 protein n=1 Tax=Actinopolymorpha sp. B17G11 TaxID=3160861 RepID=UPI0032E3DA32
MTANPHPPVAATTGVADTTPVVDTRQSPHARLRPVGVGAVRVDDAFWGPRLERNRTETVPAQQELCESTGALENFRRAAGLTGGPFHGRYYSDSDVYKWVEAAAWILAAGGREGEPSNASRGDSGGDPQNVPTDEPLGESGDRPEPGKDLDELIALFAAAQDDDGYLNTYFSADRTAERWTDLVVKHEMYCLGHLTQAAVAHVRATGKRTLLDVAIRACEHVFARFTPDEVPGTCGHPCLEMALVELYRTTREPKWLRLATWQLDSRGRGVLDSGEYLLDHAPLREQDTVTGHAVRALYLYAAAADVLLETGDPELRAAVDRWWADLAGHKTAVTGGVGARWDGEAFGAAYELPDRAYNETCAAIAVIFFAWRLLLLTGDARYRDAIETALYNGVLPGLALSGTEFFYQNPLADSGRHRRQPWFACACCPPNIARLLASLPGYAYTTSEEGVWVQLYLGGEVDLRLSDGTPVRLDVTSALPWQGRVDITVTPGDGGGGDAGRESGPGAEFTLFVPVPGWAGSAAVHVAGEPVDAALLEAGRETGYLAVRRVWSPGDTVRIEFDLSTRLVAAHPRVASAHGRVAISRGPLVYCVEQADHEGVAVEDLRLTGAESWTPAYAGDLLGGVVTLTVPAVAVEPDQGPLYRAYDPDRTVATRPVQLTAIPYYAWANREPGPMRVFLPLLP